LNTYFVFQKYLNVHNRFQKQGYVCGNTKKMLINSDPEFLKLKKGTFRLIDGMVGDWYGKVVLVPYTQC